MFKIIFEQNIILFIYILIGAFWAAKKKFTPAGIQHASYFLMNIALTCAVFSSFQTSFSIEKGRLIIKAALLAVLLIGFLFMLSLILTKILKIKLSNRPIWQGCTIFSSILFIGIPIVDALFGDVGLILLVAFNTVFNVALFSFGETIFSGKLEFSFRKLMATPAILGMLAGLVLFLLDVQLPQVLGTPIQILGSFTAPLAMMINGALFYGTPLFKVLREKDTLLFCLVRLVLVPALVMLIFRPFIANDTLFSLLVLVAAMPSGSVNSVFAEKYQGKGQLASHYIILSTLFSLITIPIVLELSSLL